MLEYFTWKKVKAHKEAAAAAKDEASKSAAETANPAVNKTASQSQTREGPQPVLSHHDEAFLREQLESAVEQPIVILEGGSGTTTPRPSPLPTPVVETPPADAGTEAGKGKEKEKEKGDWSTGIRNRFGDLRRSVSSAAERRVSKSKSPGPTKEEKGKGKEKQKEEKSEERQADEFSAALEGLNLAAEDGRAFSITPATKDLLDKFIQILKDLLNGVPTAYQDLVEFFESSSKTLEETFTTLPSFLQKIIKTLPKKMQTNLTPELLRTAAVVSPAAAAEVEALGGALPTLKELVTKPGLVMSLLKTVVNLLKTRFPAILGGTSLALSMGIFVVLFVLWYCYKRGREVRLESEAAAAAAALVDGFEGSSGAPGVASASGERKDL